jgi:large subunit ribosomal protein L22
MATASAKLSNYRQSPRKVALVAGLIRGKRVDLALAELEVLPKRAALPLAKLLRSAAANARVKGIDQNMLVVSKISVGKGTVMKRRSPRARGSSSVIRKKSSHVFLELESREVVAKKPRRLGVSSKK